MHDLLSKDRSPLCNNNPSSSLDPNLQRHLTHFSQLTHGFGSPAIIASLEAIQSYVNESLKLLEKPIEPKSDLFIKSSGQLQQQRQQQQLQHSQRKPDLVVMKRENTFLV